jgi:hypothetical protein
MRVISICRAWVDLGFANAVSPAFGHDRGH